MTNRTWKKLLRLLELLISSSKIAVARVPAAFRPKAVEQNLSEAEEILAELRKVSPETDSFPSRD